MRVKLVLPALTEATSPFFRPIKYSLFPPLGLATLAAYLDPADEVTLEDEHVETLDLTDEPDLVVIQAYITSARRSYAIADHFRRKGAHVALGGVHPTALRRRRDTRTRYSWARGRTPGRCSWRTTARGARNASTARPSGHWMVSHPSDET